MKLEPLLEWFATITLLVGVALTSANIYPLNVYISLIGNGAWIIVGLYWRKLSIITIQTIICLIYIGGLAKHFIGVS